jgi:hypothetical protein
MFGSSELSDELHALKVDVSQLLDTTREGILNASKSGADALADRIKDALSELNEALSGEEKHVQALISDRPMATLASAFVLGVVVGFAMRRH